MKLSSEKLEEIYERADGVARSLASAASILREMQAEVPTHTLEELQDIAKGIRPLTSEVALFVILHSITRRVEEVADSIQRISPQALEMMEGLDWNDLRLDFIKQRLEELRRVP